MAKMIKVCEMGDLIYVNALPCLVWCNGNERDWWSKGPRIDSESRHCQVTTLGKLFTYMCLCSPSSIIWYRSKGGDALRLGR